MAVTRKLRLIVRTGRGALPAVIGAAVLPVAACGTGELTRSGADGGAAQEDASLEAGGGNPNDASLILNPGDAARDTGDVVNPCIFVVDLPPAGVPADPGSICAVSVEPVDSPAAAQVGLTPSSAAPDLAQGTVTLAPALIGDIVGLPQITVDSTLPQLAGAQVTGITPTSSGFSFTVRWPGLDGGAVAAIPQQSRVTFHVALQVACPADAGVEAGTDGGIVTRLVTSTTYVEACETNFGFSWISSGNGCNECLVVAEMAPSPIVPDAMGDDLPLGRAIRLRVVAVARIGRSVVLFAENDGGDDLDYSWHPSGGAIERVSPDVAVWTPPPGNGPHALHVAVEATHGAAVATFRWEQAA
jgi:hypothetical protein